MFEYEATIHIPSASTLERSLPPAPCVLSKVKKSSEPSPPLTSFKRIILFVASRTSQSSANSSKGIVVPKFKLSSKSVSFPDDVDQVPFVEPLVFVAMPVPSEAKLKT